MRITASTKINNLDGPDDVKRFVGIFAEQVASVLNSNLSFSDNFSAKLITVVFPSSNTTVSADHGLNAIPTGYLLFGSSAALSLFDGNQSNTKDTIYLRSSAAGTARILVFA